uniref:Thioredoxin domain-containing protein n=1 Tax=viral metagenome TaxID=1070528 RepID=A0A6C0APL7_9ZZZZ
MAPKTRRQQKQSKRRQSIMGKIMKPMTVRSHMDLPNLMKRIMLGPITLILVKADWCGHCRELEPKYNSIMSNSHHTIQNASINDDMVQQFNEQLTRTFPKATPISPEGYPSLILVGKNGEQKGTVPNDVTLIEKATTMLGNSKTLNESESRPVIKVNATNYVPESENESIVEELEEIVPSTKSIKSPESVNLKPVSIVKTRMSGMVSPPAAETNSTVEADSIIPSLESETSRALQQKGGSLYGSLIKSAYTLAPPAILLAAAAAMFKRRKGKQTKRRQNKRRQTKRR